MRIALFVCLVFSHIAARAAESWWSANDTNRIKRTGTWQWTAHRYAAEQALMTSEDGATLELDFEGRALVLGLDTLTPPNHFGPPELGALDVFVDGKKTKTIRPRIEDREVVLTRSPQTERHQIRIVHRRDIAGDGCRIRGVRVVSEPSGDLAFTLSGEHNGAFIDARATLIKDGRVVRETLVRNWLTGQCRIAAIPPGDGYVLELRAAGWKRTRIEDIAINAGREAQLPAVYLQREWDVPADDFKFPALGRPTVLEPGRTFRTRVEASQAAIRAVRVTRQQGPATISRLCGFEEDKAAAFYYHREGIVTLPKNTPPGVYDLEMTLADKQRTRTLISRRCVVVVNAFPKNPVFMSFGHLDTWGQHQAEYLERLVAIANILAPDMTLDSNEANPAYAAGALYGLEMPFVINFGNHRAPEPGPWFGEPVGIVDFGRELAVLNFGRAWDTDRSEADTLLSARSGTRTKIVNAFESNAPVREFFDRHGVSLIHYAHGPGPAVASFGATPTVRVGKVSSESFRVIRFKDGRPISYTYRGHATAAIPFPRAGPAPIRISYSPRNDGSQRQMTARFENDLEESFPAARAVFVLRRGTYRVTGAIVEHAIESDDASVTVLSVRFDLPAKASGTIIVQP